ncbi:MAG: DUF4124 domain-containing protein [Gammaproteobacteria bacterium]|nr:DUF4124 domain-containing protein [Gammaproteobacteria bacterium]MCW8986137.1 DUF4124 domain-containing protein [Gammaproteobacteria bacterium]MCW9030058.1 DUF4124 domain-containing protein [Gammaproteobacteria bacterium]
MRILLLSTLMILASSASAGLYKWIDNDGNVHYSQKPPRDQQFKRLKAPAAAPENSKPLYQETKLKDKAGNIVATETAKNEQIRATNCENAKNNLSSYQRSRRIRDKDGNVKTLDDNERSKQIENAKQAINDFCN